MAPCPSLLTPGSRASGPGEVWGLCCHSRPPAGRAVTRALGGPVANTGFLQRAGAAQPLTTLPLLFHPATTAHFVLHRHVLLSLAPSPGWFWGVLWASWGKARWRHAVLSASPLSWDSGLLSPAHPRGTAGFTTRGQACPQKTPPVVPALPVPISSPSCPRGSEPTFPCSPPPKSCQFWSHTASLKNLQALLEKGEWIFISSSLQFICEGSQDCWGY